MTHEHLDKALIWWAAVPQTIFVLWFGVIGPITSDLKWWRAILGQAVFIKALSVMLLVDLSLLSMLWPTWPGWHWTGTAVLGLVALGATWQLAALAVEEARAKYLGKPDRYASGRNGR